MSSLISYLFTFLAIAFWGFRSIVALMASMQIDYWAQPYNLHYEIIILFLTIPCLVFVIKRNVFAAIIYLTMYVAYFGSEMYELFQAGISVTGSSQFLLDLFGIIIPLFTFFDILLNKNRVNLGLAMKSDWFYKNEQFDRKFDERADRNQYKF